MGDRPRALPRPRTRPRESAGPRWPLALRDDRRRARSHRQPAPAHPPRRRRASCGCRSHRAWPHRARRRWPWPSGTTTRARRRGPSRWPSRTRRAACATSASRARTRCSSSAWPRACCTPTGRCARARSILARNTLGQEGLWAHGISGDLPILLVRVVEENDLPLVRQVLQAQEYWRLKGLSADVVILNEHPISLPRRDARAAHRAARQRAVADVEAPAGRRVPAARRRHGRGGAHPAGQRGARGPERRPGRAGAAARPAASGARGAGGADGIRARRPSRRRPTTPRRTSSCPSSRSPTGRAASRTTAAST